MLLKIFRQGTKLYFEVWSMKAWLWVPNPPGQHVFRPPDNIMISMIDWLAKLFIRLKILFGVGSHIFFVGNDKSGTFIEDTRYNIYLGIHQNDKIPANTVFYPWRRDESINVCRCLKYSYHSSKSSNLMGWSEVFQFDDMTLLSLVQKKVPVWRFLNFFQQLRINNPIILY